MVKRATPFFGLPLSTLDSLLGPSKDYALPLFLPLPLPDRNCPTKARFNFALIAFLSGFFKAGFSALLMQRFKHAHTCVHTHVLS